MRTKRLRVPLKPIEPVKPKAKLIKYIDRESRVRIEYCTQIYKAINEVKKKLIGLGFGSKDIDDRSILFGCDYEYKNDDYDSAPLYNNVYLFYSCHNFIEYDNPSYKKEMAKYTKALEDFKKEESKYLEDLAAYTKQEEEMILTKAENIKKKRQNAR